MALIKSALSKSYNVGIYSVLTTIENGNFLHVRGYKHYNPKYKWHRQQKVLKVELPDFHKDNDTSKLTMEEMRSKMKERGILPPRYWNERPFFIGSTGGIFEPYVPPEGDGKVSFITKTGAKQKIDFLEKKGKSMLTMRKIRSYDEDFETDEFVPLAQQIYLDAHNALMTKDAELLSDFVTERGITEMLNNVKNKTMRWSFLKSIEPPRIVHMRHTDIVTKTNIFAQITVRFHTQQRLAIYDRFGRLMHGSEILAKDVLEYIVFEKHLANVYGKWRLHDKIIPDWMPQAEPPPVTYEFISNTPEVAKSEVVTKS